MMGARRILSIDGGGIKGVFPSAFLTAVERALGRNIGDYFDLIVGTSTGGIIALALGADFPASEILKFYEEDGPKIFAGGTLRRWLRHIGYSKYDQRPLREALDRRFGTLKIRDAQKRLVIPSFDLETGKVHVFKTRHHPKFEFDGNESMVEVALATTAAPSFFPTFRHAAGIPLIDGGIWANNPVGVAAVEAIGVLGWNAEDLRILSLGCTSEPFNIDLARYRALGFIYWGVNVRKIFSGGQTSAALGTAYLLAGRDRVVRVDPIVPPGRYSLDDIRAIEFLKGRGFIDVFLNNGYVP